MKKIQFTNLDEAMLELEKLEKATVIKTLGEWSYPQILNHLRFFIECSMKGFPESRSSFIRQSVGPNLFKNMKQIGYMPAGFRNKFLKEGDAPEDSKTELLKLRSAIDEFVNYSGKLAEHPIFGSLSVEDWHLVHSYHIANHLNFINYGKKTGLKKPAAKKSKPSGSTKKTVAKKKTPAAAKKIVKKTVKKSAKKKSAKSAAVKKTKKTSRS